MMRRFTILAGAVLLAAPALHADQVALLPDKDNTLYEDADGALSNGAGNFMFTGTTRQPAGRRAVLHFDVAGNVPAGSTITGVSLTLELSRRPFVGGPNTVSMHRLLADWGEGTSNAGNPGGSGAPSTPGDATWIHTFYPDSFWTSPGGDFAAAVSASQLIDTNDLYVWSGGALVADVQDMLDDDAANFGWIMIGGSTPADAARFHTRHNMNDPALLEITFDPPVMAVPAFSLPGVLGLGLLLLAATGFVARRRRRPAEA